MLTDQGSEVKNVQDLFPPCSCKTLKEGTTMNVSQILRPHAAETPDKTAIIFDEREISYGQLDDLVTRMAPYKVPVAVEVIDEIPRLASGKALRRMLRDKEWNNARHGGKGE
jgi:acyl-CoA synthetase (AMP-forming)/AMP-acid ligase II